MSPIHFEQSRVELTRPEPPQIDPLVTEFIELFLQICDRKLGVSEQNVDWREGSSMVEGREEADDPVLMPAAGLVVAVLGRDDERSAFGQAESARTCLACDDHFCVERIVVLTVGTVGDISIRILEMMESCQWFGQNEMAGWKAYFVSELSSNPLAPMALTVASV